MRISFTKFIVDAADLAGRAVTHDKIGNGDIAVYFYSESVSLLTRAKGELHRRLSAVQGTESGSDIEKRIKGIDKKVLEYEQRIKDFERTERNEDEKCEKGTKVPVKSLNEYEFEMATFLVSKALIEDELRNDDKAVGLYADAIQICLQIKNGEKLDSHSQFTCKVETLTMQALERAEAIKGVKKDINCKRTLPQLPTVSGKRKSIPENLKAAAFSDSSQTKSPGFWITEEEKRVLLSTSRVNGVKYLPYIQKDRYEKFAYPIPFSDPNGHLKLSPKQKAQLHRWARPHEIWDNPKMFDKIDCLSIKQMIVSDCSVVASLAVSALYEKRFGKRLITANISPQNKAGLPVYNPSGKYLVKMNVNGVWRKVIIDDFLPIGKHGQILCSHSKTKGELWVSLLEKAYMKVMEGYDFPGSNADIDLHAFTGWIPETVLLRSQGKNFFDTEKTFKMLHSRHHKGHVLITVGTGTMSPEEETRTGLVSRHAYAVLDIREHFGKRLFLLKNPWSSVRWKGKYSELDKVNWTNEMKRAFKYDPSSAAMFDNGVFWIEYRCLIQFFEVFSLNWNPALFPYTTSVHKTWDATIGPTKDRFNIGENPQYKLEIRSETSAAVWCYLTRHITEIEDFKNNHEYLALFVYDADGKRVYYPNDPPPIIEGVRINSPHYLCKIIVPAAANKRFTVVVSQYEKMKTIHYTLRAYSSCPFTLEEIKNPCTYIKELTGEWNGRNKSNPRYQFTLKSQLGSHIMLVELR